MVKLKNLLENEYVKSAIFLAIILGSIGAFWFGLRSYLRTGYPLLAVASESMVPTLNVGDLIVVRGGLGVSEIVAAYDTGDIIVFHKPSDPRELIVHRAVEKLGSGNNTYLRTKGDNNVPVDGWKIYDSHLIGKVVGTVPYVGHVPLFVHTPTGMTIIVVLIIALIFLEFIIPIIQEKRIQPMQLEEETEALRQ